MENTEREIDLLHLALPIAMQWRKFVLVALIGLVLGTLFMLGRGGSPATSEQAAQEAGLDPEKSYQYKLAMYWQLKTHYETALKIYQQQIAQQKAYNEQSLLMQIDPFNKPVARAVLRFQNARDFQDIFQQYDAAIAEAAFWQGLVKQYGGEPKYFRELVGMRIGDGTTEENPEVLLSVTMPDTAMSEAVLDALVAIFEPKTVQLVQRRVALEIDASAGWVSDFYHAKRQTLTQIQNVHRSALQGSYSQIQNLLYYYNNLAEPKKPAAKVTATKQRASISRQALKGAVLGAILACLALASFFGLRLLFPGRVLSAEEFAGTYQLNCLMMLAPRPQRQHMLALDRLLLRWSDSPRFGKLNEAERWAMAAENIRVRVPDGEQVLLVGTVAQAQLDKVQTALSSQLAAHHLTSHRFVEQDVATLREINTSHHIVLVEELGRSVYKEVDNALQMLRERQKNILGCILV